MTDTRETLRQRLRAEQSRPAPHGSQAAVDVAAVAVCKQLREWGGVGRLAWDVEQVYRYFEDVAQQGETALRRWGTPKAATVCEELRGDRRSLQLLPPEVTTAFNAWQEAKDARDQQIEAETPTDPASGPRL